MIWSDGALVGVGGDESYVVLSIAARYAGGHLLPANILGFSGGKKNSQKIQVLLFFGCRTQSTSHCH
jgi:hypothetical protein